ncbi:MAG: CRISPR-associated helicase/endonuclease Cas3, partial [Magnetococcales bacterium]|nr:CRISPR-associated helicase/endonuclease Cas3 [Magnetococcales bacterium]
YAHFLKHTELHNNDLSVRAPWIPWMQAIMGHHGQLPEGYSGSPLDAEEALIRADHQARQTWLEASADLFLTPVGLGLEHAPPPCPDMFAGFCSVCDWLGSDSSYFSANATPAPLESYWQCVQPIAAQALRAHGLIRTPLKQGGMSHLYPGYTPRGVQHLVDERPVRRGLTLIEAATGSGKTEAALAYASRLLAAGLAESVVFALPSQATANAMMARLESVAPMLFPGGDANLVLAHGLARFNVDFAAIKARAHGSVQGAEEAAVQCSQWLAQSRKRVFLGQIGVCTVDQVLLSVLPVRHHFVRALIHL